jgi:hypothetical protein
MTNSQIGSRHLFVRCFPAPPQAPPVAHPDSPIRVVCRPTTTPVPEPGLGWTEPDQTSPTQPRRPSLSPALSASTMPQPAFLSSLRSPAPASPQPSLQPSRGYHVELGAREKAVSPPPLNPILFPSPRFGTPICGHVMD